MMDFEQVKRFMVNDVIEVIPLAFMRGRTLNDSVIILDEAQNTTAGQMLMFLTRLGPRLEDDRDRRRDAGRPARGHRAAAWSTRWRSCGASRGSAMVELERGDIVRHRLVQNIVNAYERHGSVRATCRDRVGR